MAELKRKRKWYQVTGGELFNNVVIGETLADNVQSTLGKSIAVSLGHIYGDPRKQQYRITFKIIKLDGERPVAEIVSYSAHRSNLRRFVRKGVTKIEDSFVAAARDGVRFRVKPIFVSRSGFQRGVGSALIKRCREFVAQHLQQLDAKDFIQQVLHGKVQQGIKQELRKIYPLSVFDLRAVEKIA